MQGLGTQNVTVNHTHRYPSTHAPFPPPSPLFILLSPSLSAPFLAFIPSNKNKKMASRRYHLLLLLLLVTTRCSAAQSPTDNNSNPYFPNANFKPSTAILIVVLISAFFFLAFFSLYIRQCTSSRPRTSTQTIAVSTLSHRRHHGLDPQILSTFPTLLYSDVMSHKLGDDSLECAVCLSKFEADDALRLLPKCSHVFHPECIDAWLAAHATCPVCRSDLSDIDPISRGPEAAALPSVDHEPIDESSNQEEHVVVAIEVAEAVEELEKFVIMKRAKSRGKMVSFPRSHSMGHSVVLPGENLDRFTLRLPESMRREMLKRTVSCVAFLQDESGRRGFRGRSEWWGSFLMRTVSMKGGGFFWGNESTKGEGSSTLPGGGGMSNAVIAPFDRYGGESPTPSASKV